MSHYSRCLRRSQTDKREIFGIRKFKVGVASVTIASAFFLSTGLGASSVLADVPADTTEAALTEEGGGTELVASSEDAEPETESVEQVSEEMPADAPAAEPSEVTMTTATEVEQPAGSSALSSDDKEEPAPVLLMARAAEEERKTAEPIAEQHIRLHFEGLEDEAIESYGLWTWGAVANPSDGNKWPTDVTPFVASQADDFGYYVDLKQSDNGGKIGYLLLKDGEKVTENDQEIDPMVEDMNEAWVTSNFTTYTYQPLADENSLRIHYKREGQDYSDWAVWAWGDVDGTFEKWPSDALDFSGQDERGVYLDLPLSKGLASNIGFLLVNKATGSQTKDLSFSDRESHSHIFINEGDETVYTNPYGVLEVIEQDFSQATPGQAGVGVTATSYRAFNYNENGLIDISLDNPNNATITRMEVDTTAIGGGVIEVSTELNRVTITATSDTPAGTYDLPVRVYDQDNGYYDTTVTVQVTERQKADGERDWDEQVIYFMLTDRFYNGDPSNDDSKTLAKVDNKMGAYQGGDFKGVTEKLDYLKELGVSAIWLTPIVENVAEDYGTSKDGEYYAYHGYWAKNFEKLNPHLGTLEEFHTLIDEAADRGINIIVDVVLNHSGYGTEDDFAGMVRTADEEIAGDDQKGSLSNLPDFKTEDMAVRQQLVDWQTAWLTKATTPKGNSIYGFRVDTVKHVDDVTWQHFKNELALKDADFHLVGESWGANYKDTKGDLGIGTMDSLLDFGFKDIAKQAVNGRLKAAGEELTARNAAITSSASLAQFLGSHDEDGFLYSIGGDEGKQKVATSLLLMAKGQPVIYYGEELGQTGANNWPQYDNRYNLDWDKVESSDMLSHYQKLLSFRANHSELLARGDHSTVAVNDSQKWLVSKRSLADEAIYLLNNVKEESQDLILELSQESVVTDAYSGKSYQASQEADGKWTVTVDAPAMADGGTMLLTTSAGDIVNVTSQEVVDDPIVDNSLRIHFKSLPSDNLNSLGLWLWNDVEIPSEQVAGWPDGATSFADAKQDDYGYYLDIKMIDGNRSQVSYLINNKAGDNLTGDKSIEIISQVMNEIWLDEDFTTHYYEPQEKGTLRINYYRTDGDYANKSLWLWGSADAAITSLLGDWPDGVDFENQGKYGVYIDVPLANFDELGFLLLDEGKEGDAVKINPNDYKFNDLANHSQIFLKDDDATIYTNPYFANLVRVTGANQISTSQIEAVFTSLEGLEEAEVTVTDSQGQALTVTEVALNEEGNKVTLTGDFSQNAPYQITYGNDTVTTRQSWQYTDSLYAYDGDLGARLVDNGRAVDLTLWSPSADAVSVVIYDKDDQDKVFGELDLTAAEKGTWQTTLTADNGLGLDNYTDYYYHYKIKRGDQEVLVLDPYAKSLSAWNSDKTASGNPADKIAKAAFVNPSAVGPELIPANITGYESREDAVIYEAHVRDFTSDQVLDGQLTAPFGTFLAFIEKLDYLQDLGVTHIQLLPVMSYYFVNELATKERLSHYDSSDTNYNWGYDPQSYFALTGAYSTDPTDPEKRIAEFKELVNAIHERGMGIILDVVYNHTAQVSIFEDLEPNYYHFMEADGTAKSSFGGGRLGTTHHMSRRVLVDSIAYLVSEYGVDGFRFDMMGDHDAETIQLAYDKAKELNPNILMLGEGWVTYAGDANDSRQPADQSWMTQTDSVASFSDDIRNQLKSGYPNEGTPAFITGGARDITSIFSNIKAQPTNFTADDPGDVIQYIAAHDNLTLYDVIAQSIKKDPSVAENDSEIHRRLRLGNLMVLTAQGTSFLHSGQEYGRTKQFKDEAYRTPVSDDLVPNKSHLLTNSDGTPFEYPYFIHDSYDSTDAINHFDWTKATAAQLYPENTKSQAYTKGLIALRKSTDAFRLKDLATVEDNVRLITRPGENGIATSDLVIGYQVTASNGDIYAVLVNADAVERTIVFGDEFSHLLGAEVIVDGDQASIEAIANPVGLTWTADGLQLDALTATVLRLTAVSEAPEPIEEVSEGPEIQPEEDIMSPTPEIETPEPTAEEDLPPVSEEEPAEPEVTEEQEPEMEEMLTSEPSLEEENPSNAGGAGQSAAAVAQSSSLDLPETRPASYSRVARAQAEGGLPNTGDAGSLISLVGLGLSALGLTGIKRRQD